MSSIYSIGAMNQLADALEQAGYTSDQVTKLRSSQEILMNLKSVFAGTSEIVAIKHLIDCDADPFIPEGWKVEDCRKGGQLEWDPEKIVLHLDKAQKDGSIVGNELRKRLKDLPVLNANVLDYLLAHPNLIPENWKNKYIFFWGTIYRSSDDGLCVRCLHWNGYRWRWHSYWLDDGFYDDLPAALLAS